MNQVLTTALNPSDFCQRNMARKTSKHESFRSLQTIQRTYPITAQKIYREQGQILQYNSISCFGSHINSKRLANADNFCKNLRKSCPGPVGQLSLGTGEGSILREVMCLKRNKGQYKVLSGEFCLRDSKVEQMALRFLHIYYSNVNSDSKAPESSKQNPPHRTLGLPFFSYYEHITCLKNLPSPAASESLPYWFQGSFAAMFVLNYWLREFFVCIRLSL